MTDTQQSFAYEQYTIKLDTGKRIYYIYAPETEFDENLKNLKKPIIDRLGFLPSRLTLPKQIGVMGLFDDSGSNGIENKKVTITTHPAKNESGMQRVLWFDEK